MKGKIRKLIRERGFGFIAAEDSKDVFFHRSALAGEDFDALNEGNSVEFDLERGPKGLQARNVRVDDLSRKQESGGSTEESGGSTEESGGSTQESGGSTQESGGSTQERGESIEAYCLKCRSKREIKDPETITMKNGRPATQGTCPVCGSKMFRMGKS